MIEKLTISEDVIRLIPHFNFTEAPQISDLSDEQTPRWGLDYNSIYGGSFLLEDLALILGVYDKVIPETAENADGPRYPEDVEQRLLDAHTFVIEHMKDIEDIIHQFVVKGGITAGTYKCDHRIRIWERDE